MGLVILNRLEIAICDTTLQRLQKLNWTPPGWKVSKRKYIVARDHLGKLPNALPSEEPFERYDTSLHSQLQHVAVGISGARTAHTCGAKAIPASGPSWVKTRLVVCWTRTAPDPITLYSKTADIISLNLSRFTYLDLPIDFHPGVLAASRHQTRHERGPTASHQHKEGR
ncbi:hypothetical protein GGR56DRAFT_173968 [Xylariaceae sp. FL0804]|nr:hypothetical protein GGR56DRAFT_173968 [Xylariaceae sp. FL0804]